MTDIKSLIKTELNKQISIIKRFDTNHILDWANFKIDVHALFRTGSDVEKGLYPIRVTLGFNEKFADEVDEFTHSSLNKLSAALKYKAPLVDTEVCYTYGRRGNWEPSINTVVGYDVDPNKLIYCITLHMLTKKN